MSNLPEEIIVEILSRLPVKSLLRFKCVSNPWRVLISDPSFAKLHLKQTSEHNAVIDHHYILVFSSWKFITIDFNPSESYHYNDLKLPCPQTTTYYMRILGSCNGLIFLRVSFEDLVIWNPSTRDFKLLPKPGSSPNHIALCGFGFDASIDDYKAVVGAYKVASTDGDYAQVEVFTLKTNTWRKVPGIDIEKKRWYGQGALVNGALHWLKGYNSATIMSFDFAQEQFVDFASLPDSVALPALQALESVYTLQGRLCLYIVQKADFKKNEVWVMKEYGDNSSWTKLLTIIPNLYTPTIKKPLCILKSGELLLQANTQILLTYRPNNTNTYKPPICKNCERYSSVEYVESLVSLN